jgi:hypothetical protein
VGRRRGNSGELAGGHTPLLPGAKVSRFRPSRGAGSMIDPLTPAAIAFLRELGRMAADVHWAENDGRARGTDGDRSPTPHADNGPVPDGRVSRG